MRLSDALTQEETLLAMTFESTFSVMTCEHLIRRYLPYKARKETGNEPAWPLSQYENEKTYALDNNDLNQVWRPAVLVKTRV